MFQAAVSKAEELVLLHQEYQRGLHMFEDWLEQEQNSLALLSPLNEDVNALENTLKELQVNMKQDFFYGFIIIIGKKYSALPNLYFLLFLSNNVSRCSSYIALKDITCSAQFLPVEKESFHGVPLKLRIGLWKQHRGNGRGTKTGSARPKSR